MNLKRFMVLVWVFGKFKGIDFLTECYWGPLTRISALLSNSWIDIHPLKFRWRQILVASSDYLKNFVLSRQSKPFTTISVGRFFDKIES